MPELSTTKTSQATAAWPLVLGLVGLDYFSTLAYLPSIAVEAAGPLAPFVAGFVVLVTFGLTVPVYFYILGRAPDGRGATGMIEELRPGWRGKLLVLVLLGFSAADFVITRSLSVADAATHLIHNPHGQALLSSWSPSEDWLKGWLGNWWGGQIAAYLTPQLITTLFLSLLSFAAWWLLRGGVTRGMLWGSAIVTAAFLWTTGMVTYYGLIYLVGHPEMMQEWWGEVTRAGEGNTDWRQIIQGVFWMTLWCFPQMALGLSGFEMIMTVTPLVRPDGGYGGPVRLARAWAARKLIVVAAMIMGVYLVSTVLVTTLFVPAEELSPGGAAEHRALAYLAHGGRMTTYATSASLNLDFGEQFGDLFDLSAVAILCMAGASAMVGLRGSAPLYLHRLGMELSWAGRVSVIMHVLNATILVVTLVFHASLSAQQWAYATSVLVLMAGASLAAAWDAQARAGTSFWRKFRTAPFALATGFFLAMTGVTVLINHSGLVIASAFVVNILITSFFSRWMRSTELRFEGFEFADAATRERWQEICRLPAKILAPHRPGGASLAVKSVALRQQFYLNPTTPVIFVQAVLDDPSDFYQAPCCGSARKMAWK